MILLIQLLVFLTVLGIWWYLNDQKRYSKYPPGPFRFPFIGNLPQLLLNASYLPSTTFQKLGDIYGEVMFIKVGQTETIVFNSLDALHEILTHDKTAGRYQYEFVKDRHDNKNFGLIWSHGRTWQNLRRFTMRNLRDFGFGKSSAMDVVINEEIEKFHQDFLEKVRCAPGNMIHVTDLFSVSMVNVLWRLVSGKAYELDDPKIKKLIQLNRDWFATTRIGFDFSDPFPFLRNWFPDWTGRTSQKMVHEELYEYGKELLDEQRNFGSVNSDPETFIDAFNRKIEDSRSDPETDFNDEQFVYTILDLFTGGSETSSNTLNFGILYMILNPEIQEKVQSELDHEIAEDVIIDSSMKSRLPYTSATILEILRFSTIIPIITSREATEDFFFRGYLIKKGTALMPNVYGIHHSEKIWDDPENFRPERFLNTDGTAINQKVADQLKTFGAGKRFCLGQSLAELTLFQYFASTLRKFKFVKIPGSNPTTDPMLGITLTPKPFDVRVIDRSRIKH